MTDTAARKLNYHLKSNKNNLDKSNPQILTSSPTIEHKINSKSHNFNNFSNFHRLDKKPTAIQNLEETDEEVFKNTILSMNERDNVNYLIESSNDNVSTFKRETINNQKIFKTSINDLKEITKNREINQKIIHNNQHINQSLNSSNNVRELILNDRDEIYIKSTEKLLFNLKSTMEHFNEVPSEFTVKNSDLKEVAVKMLKDELDKVKSDKEILFSENKKLKDKIKLLLKSGNSNGNNINNSSLSKSNQNISNTISYIEDNNVPVNKVVESFLKLQLKYDELEKENNYLKTENEDLNRKLTITKKFVTEDKEKDTSSKYSPYNKSRSGTKASHNGTSNRRSSNEMESLIKEQLKCMQKMLHLVQEGTNENRIQDNDYLQLESEMHFEESCNITNMTSNSNDYNEENDNINSSEKDFFDHRNSISRTKIESVIKPIEKGKVRENAIDEIPVVEKNSNTKKFNNIPINNPNTNTYKQYYFNKEQAPTSRIRNINSNSSVMGMNLNNYSKSKTKNGDFSHRVMNK